MLNKKNQTVVSIESLEGRRMFTKYTIADLGVTVQETTAPYSYNVSNMGVATNYTVGEDFVGETPVAYLGTVKKGKPVASALAPVKGYPFATPTAVNNSGTVVGYSHTYDGYSDTVEATEWIKGKPVDLGTGIASKVNASGEVVGTLIDSNLQPHAEIFGKTDIDLGTLGGPTAGAIGVNDSGTVVGWAENTEGVTKPFIYSNGTMTAIGPNGFEDTETGVAYAVNNQNVVVGTLNSEPFVYSNGTLTTLPGTGQLNLGTPMAINNSNVIVGFDNSGAAVWVKNKLSNLNTLVSNGKGWELNEAVGVNDQGQIIGYGSFDGQEHEFLLTPQK